MLVTLFHVHKGTQCNKHKDCDGLYASTQLSFASRNIAQSIWHLLGFAVLMRLVVHFFDELTESLRKFASPIEALRRMRSSNNPCTSTASFSNSFSSACWPRIEAVAL